ncbi:MAG: N-formylglutamate amidohydrolase [Pseudomonadota bacterium]
MDVSSELPFFVSIPHSGEEIPPEVTWLSSLPEETLMRDVDRFVDQLYAPVIKKLSIPLIKTQWHRYVIDLNRSPDQFDQDSVVGATNEKGTFPKGLHWSVTTHGETLIPKPMSMETHQKLVQSYYLPFHDSVQQMRESIKDSYGHSFHLDLHSMPSLGTSLHPDPGQTRAEVVISDFHGQSAEPFFKELVIESFQEAGFQVAYNWPYIGGGITQKFGAPGEGFNTIQVELNRVLYMNEETKKLNTSGLSAIQEKLGEAIENVVISLKDRLAE